MSRTEQVVLLDESGTAAGTADKAGVHHADTPLHLAFSCYVFDADHRLLLTRRALHKRTFPGVWTNTCCGHPAPGEPMPDAVGRRVRQELGLELSGLRLLLPRFRYRAEMGGVVENEMCPVFTALAASDVHPDPEEVDDVAWVSWASFRSEVLAGDREVSQWCVEQVRELPEEPWAAPAADVSELPAAAR
ncbi:isopentenyl-diphosphate Delta-isomerase [Nocardioides mangrovicus]|uniref:Isopentenyl-diphosphate Delta-isomerase n=1 Tax=Nocardioides mangrovicus TaxID=2478913 RepID=A0A3L8P0Q0_9ACTN|nr:isopentenyl-diphosphate Delta-isomerase [Nocardioides mangrovicus]RLV48169.1 isopentenyl-diphosphate Delta-isomerase [Nocardioides mangrovicus]